MIFINFSYDRLCDTIRIKFHLVFQLSNINNLFLYTYTKET